MRDSGFLVHGTGEPLPDWTALCAGPLRMQFDPENLSLRYIRLGDHEVLRGIYAAVRDRNWGTVLPRVANLRIRAEADNFTITFEAVCQDEEVEFIWQGALTGKPDGSVRFDFDGQSRARFWRNRIGLCVLHPLRECAGRACLVKHLNGEWERCEFPLLVAPSQPFREVCALRHTITGDLQAEVQFEGDQFETEDHRNWTDASFKTYSTPLARPAPVELNKGDRVQQTVELLLRGGPVIAPTISTGPIVLSPDRGKVTDLPAIGLQAASHGQPLNTIEIRRLQSLQLAHLRCEVRFAEPDWKTRLHRAASDARLLGVGLQLALHPGAAAESEVRALAAELAVARPTVIQVLILHAAAPATALEWVRSTVDAFEAFAPRWPIAAGTDANFAEWNRNRPSPASIAMPCYSMNPQVHAFDHAALVENVGGQGGTVETAWRISGRPVVVSPVTLRPRFNPNASAQTSVAPGALPPQVDPRQMSLFGAAWTLASIAELSRSGLAISLTYYETTGWLGVMEIESGSPFPDLFPSIPGSVYPLFHIFADIAGYRRSCAVAGVEQNSVTALALLNDSDQFRILLANLTREPQALRLALSGRSAAVRMIDPSTVEAASCDPERFRASSQPLLRNTGGSFEIAMGPYAVACVDEM